MRSSNHCPLRALLPIVLILLCGCSSILPFSREESHTLDPFTSDGCSMFPDGTHAEKDLWSECCMEHDIAYWRGGTEEDREEADERLRECVVIKTGDRKLAQTIFNAVQTWGAPIYPSKYRWGYGWQYGRDYGPLTDRELEQVVERLTDYFGYENISGD